MGKVEENKKKKQESLLNTAYELFTTKGINSTAISDIVEKAGVAKGTFYLYFKDKYDIKDKLVAHKARALFSDADAALGRSGIQELDGQLIFIIDHVISALTDNEPLLSFISKNLVMGALRSVLLTGESSDGDIYDKFLSLVEHDVYEYEEVDVMLFTIVELVGSTAYDSIIYKKPLPIEAYKPFLYRVVRMIIESHRKTETAAKSG